MVIEIKKGFVETAIRNPRKALRGERLWGVVNIPEAGKGKVEVKLSRDEWAVLSKNSHGGELIRYDQTLNDYRQVVRYVPTDEINSLHAPWSGKLRRRP